MSDPISPARATRAKFTTGSTMGHVTVMTLTSTIGLMALFFVDLADMYFLGLLGEDEVAGAIGYAGAILYFNLSVCIGLSITASALVSRALGARRPQRARRQATNSCLLALATTAPLAVAIWVYAPQLMGLLGARGAAFDHAVVYLRIVCVTFPVLALGVTLNGVLRGAGDARRAMYCTLAGGITNAVLDPILIFGLGLGVPGAAIASAIARIAVFAVAIYSVVVHHDLLGPTQWRRIRSDLRPILSIAVPAVLTNVATPAAQAYVTAAIAVYGSPAVAGFAIIGRIVPVSFGVVFALSGAVGPIIGQNFGARLYDRVVRTYVDALKFNAVYVIAVSVLLIFLSDQIALVFNAGAQASELIAVFCVVISFTFMFNGAQYVANAAFNNLGRAHYSTLFNWAKSTLGTVPFVIAGSALYGAPGILLGQAAGSVLFGLAAAGFGYWFITRLPGAKIGATPRPAADLPIER